MNRLRKQIEAEKNFCQENSYIYAPNSIRHCDRYPVGEHANETILRIQNGRLSDFIEWLFEHSEHCDHISQSDAWYEFELFERPQRETWNRNKV